MKDFNLKPTSSILNSIKLPNKKYKRKKDHHEPLNAETLIKVTLHHLYASNRHIERGLNERSTRTIYHGLNDFNKHLSTILKLSESQDPILKDLIQDSFGRLIERYHNMFEAFGISFTSSIQPSMRRVNNTILNEPLTHRVKSFIHDVDQTFIDVESHWYSGLILDIEA